MFNKSNGQRDPGKDSEQSSEPNGPRRPEPIPLPGCGLFGSAAGAKSTNGETLPSAGDKPRLVRLEPDPDAAIAYLKDTFPAGPWVLTAIIPDGSTKTRAFKANDHA